MRRLPRVIKRLGPENLALVKSELLAGEIVALPTETVYGLAGNALLPEVLIKIFTAKHRPLFDPLIVHIPAEWDLPTLQSKGLIDVSQFNDFQKATATRLTKEFWPGPLTLLFPRGRKIPDLATSGLDTVGIRMPDHSLIQRVLTDLQIPLAAPSANRFGGISPTCAADVMTELGSEIKYVLDGGVCEKGLESTIILIEKDHLQILRPGALELEKIENALRTQITKTTERLVRPQTPGQLPSHYAPRKPFFRLPCAVDKMDAKLVSSVESWLDTQKSWGGLWLKSGPLFSTSNAVMSQILSPTAQASEAAQCLFQSIRRLDENPSVECLVCEPMPSNDGLFFAINDRLTRASIPIPGFLQ